jgi:deazaflavin-dependent oxidoreductase (nitroreductase family)
MSTDQLPARGAARNAVTLSPRARRLIRAAARLVNPLVLRIAGRRWMPILGILHHRGQRSGRAYATPLGMRPLGDGFVMPRTFGKHAAWSQNVQAAGWAVVTWGGATHTVFHPQVVDAATAKPAFPATSGCCSPCWGLMSSCCCTTPRPAGGQTRARVNDDHERACASPSGLAACH